MVTTPSAARKAFSAWGSWAAPSPIKPPIAAKLAAMASRIMNQDRSPPSSRRAARA